MNAAFGILVHTTFLKPVSLSVPDIKTNQKQDVWNIEFQNKALNQTVTLSKCIVFCIFGFSVKIYLLL